MADSIGSSDTAICFSKPTSSGGNATTPQDQRLPGDVWFAANICEEGMGNLGGIGAVYEKLAAKLGAPVIVEGMAVGHIYHAGIAVRRLEITCRTTGGRR